MVTAHGFQSEDEHYYDDRPGAVRQTEITSLHSIIMGEKNF